MAFRHPKFRRGVDDLDLDVGQRLPERPRGVGHHDVARVAVKRHDRDLARSRLHDLEVRTRHVRVGLGEQQCALRRQLRLKHAARLRDQPPTRVEAHMPPRLQHAHEASVTEQQRPLVILHNDFEHTEHSHDVHSKN